MLSTDVCNMKVGPRPSGVHCHIFSAICVDKVEPHCVTNVEGSVNAADPIQSGAGDRLLIPCTVLGDGPLRCAEISVITDPPVVYKNAVQPRFCHCQGIVVQCEMCNTRGFCQRHYVGCTSKKHGVLHDSIYAMGGWGGARSCWPCDTTVPLTTRLPVTLTG